MRDLPIVRSIRLPERLTRMARRRNPLEKYFEENDQRAVHKWLHYFEIYHRHFARFRGRKVNVLEIGVSQGGSLQMWQKYFGRRAMIYGIDVDPRCKQFEDDQTRIFIGDQEDRDFLRQVADDIGRIHVLIDDGGHRMGQLIATFEELYPRMALNGVYLAEDLHTCYRPGYGGGYRAPGTFIEYAKGLIDKLYAWQLPDEQERVDRFTRRTKSMHFYNGVLVLERGKVSRPTHRRTGRPSFGRRTRAESPSTAPDR